MTTTLHLFTSNTCPHCPATKDFAKRFSNEHHVAIHEHNIQTNSGREQAAYFGVQSVPTIIFFDEQVQQPIGLRGLPSEQATTKALRAAQGKAVEKKSLYQRFIDKFD